MNIISCDAAYSFYPKATFERRTSLICERSIVPQTAVAHEKYRKRGWNVVLNLTHSQYKEDYHVEEIRRVGDDYCWTIALDTSSITERIPLPEGSKPLTCDPVIVCNWIFIATFGSGYIAYRGLSRPLYVSFDYITTEGGPFTQLLANLNALGFQPSGGDSEGPR